MSEKSEPNEKAKVPSTKPFWPWIFASPFVIVLCEYLAVAPLGAQFFLWFSLIFVIGFLPAAFAIIALPFAAIFSKHRKASLVWWLAAAVYLPLSAGGFILGKDIRMAAFHNLSVKSVPLVNAIHNYSDDKGHPPTSLDDLVPDYLDEIPKTRMMAYSKYRYLVGESANRYEDNPWVLEVFTPSGGINFDKFMYFPLQNYPQHGHGGAFE